MAHQDLLAVVDLAQEIDRFAPRPDASGRRAETIIKTDQIRVVLVTMLAGASLERHTAPGPITILGLRGSFVVSANDQELELSEGRLLALEAGAPHAVRAVEAGAFLLTIVWRQDSEKQSPTAGAATHPSPLA